MLAPLALAAMAGCEDSDLRERIAAAQVFSPGRAELGDEPRVRLGGALFFDAELSGNRNISCGVCHLPELHAVDQRSVSTGEGGVGVGPERVGGPPLPRPVLPPFNRSFATALLWDGRVEMLEDGTIAAPIPLPDGIETLMEAQALLPLLDRDEMRGQPTENDLADLGDDQVEEIFDAILARVLALDAYRNMFYEAYPGETEFTIVHLVRAIVAFENQIWELTDTRFDDFLGGGFTPPDENALTPEERLGADLFFGDAGCDRCHNGPLLSDMEFHNIGTPQIGPGKDPATGLDEGRFLVTGDPADRFAFRTPPLRNVALTGPYLHSGTYRSLEDVIRQHIDPESALRGFVEDASAGREVHDDPATIEAVFATVDPDVRPLRELGPTEIAALVAFLRSLTSATEERIFPGAGLPESVPSGLPVPGREHRVPEG